MNQKIRKIELLSPAGNLEKVKTALAFGADAVYAGIPDFSMRVRINDFSIEKIEEATEYCHKKGNKLYATINIVAHNHHLDKIKKHVRDLKKIGVDAVIVSDPGVLEICKSIWPNGEYHLSTQANCTNLQTAKFWQEQGIKRVVLGREVTLKEIKEIHKNCPKLELEVFVHGAMCMSYSGRCFLSKYFVGRSGNLGDCVQPCRWSYEVKSKKLKVESVELTEEKRPEQPLELIEDEHGSYILNSKDLCLIKYIDKLIDAGVVSFKIEGRAKSVYYQSMVTGVYKKAINEIGKEEKNRKKIINNLYKELEIKLVHRGYTEGFLLGEKGDQNIEKSHEKCDWEFCGQVVESKKLSSFAKATADKKVKSYKVKIKVHNSLKIGDEIEIVVPFYDIIKLKLKKIIDEKTGKELSEAHGGQKRVVIIEINKEIPEYSVLRRKIN